GVHAGHAIAGEIGSNERRHYTVVGRTVNAALRISKMNDLPREVAPIVLSKDAVREAGMLLNDEAIEEDLFLEFSADLPGGDAPESLFAIRAAATDRVRSMLGHATHRRHFGRLVPESPS